MKKEKLLPEKSDSCQSMTQMDAWLNGSTFFFIPVKFSFVAVINYSVFKINTIINDARIAQSRLIHPTKALIGPFAIQ